MKQFYTHLVEIESIVIELDKMDLTNEQKAHLASLIDSTLHHSILDAVLSELSEADKKAFLEIIKEDDHGKVWQFLNEKVDHIEDKIKKAADDLTKLLHKDLREARRAR